MEQPNKVPLEYCHRWIMCALKVGERHYTLFLISGLIMYITLFVCSVIPYLGAIASPLLSFMFSLAGMRLVHQIIKEKTLKTDLDTYLKFVFDPMYIQRFRTQYLILAGMGLLSIASTFTRITTLTLAISVIVYFLTYLFSFSAFMMIQNPHVFWRKAIDKIFQGFTLNAGALTMAMLLLSLFAGLSLALCFVPFLLYFVPMTFAVSYLIYASIFENMDIEAFIKEWSSKPVVETHVLPPEA